VQPFLTLILVKLLAFILLEEKIYIHVFVAINNHGLLVVNLKKLLLSVVRSLPKSFLKAFG